MAVSIYQTFDSYPLLIQHKLRARPCQSNSLSPHNNTNVFPLGTVQLIKAKFVWRRICGSQENAGRGFSTSQGRPRADLRVVCLLSSSLHKIMRKLEMHTTNGSSPVQTSSPGRCNSLHHTSSRGMKSSASPSVNRCRSL